MTNKVLLGLILAVAIGVVVVGSSDKARMQPAAAITAVSKTVADTKTPAVQAPDLTIGADTSNLSTFVAAAQAVDLAGALQEKGGSYTIFAPSDKAFEAYAGGDEKALFESNTKTSLSALLKYHVVAGRYTITDLKDGMTLVTISGEKITVTEEKGTIRINGVVVGNPQNTTGDNIVYLASAVFSTRNGAGVVVATPTPDVPTNPEGRSEQRIVCVDNGDGTITYWDESRSGIGLGFLGTIWGKWRQTSESQTVNSEGKGCRWLPGFVEYTIDLPTEPTKDYSGVTRNDDLALDALKQEIRAICTDNGDGTAFIETKVRQSVLWIFHTWKTTTSAQIKGNCK